MASRIRLYDRTGRFVYELSAPAFREWVLNDIGTANLTVKAEGLQDYVQHGNYITIEHEKLDAWVGVINTPRPWSSKVITVNAKSAMWLFSQRVGSYEQPVSGSWGAVLSQMIGIVNSAENTLLRMGDYDDGRSYSSTVDMSNVYTYLQRALAQSQTRLDFRPVVTNGSLAIYVDMKPTLYTASELRIEEGVNVKSSTSILVEQGDIYNDVTIIGVGLEQEKYTARAVDEVSISKYGRRQILFAEGQSQADVDRLAIVRLEQYKEPRKSLGISVMDKGNTLSFVRAGNSGYFELKTVDYTDGNIGFKGTAYVRVVQFDDKTEDATLVCQEI